MDDDAGEAAENDGGPSQQQHDEPSDDWAALCAAAEEEDDDDAAAAGGIAPPSEFEFGSARSGSVRACPAAAAASASSSAAAAKPSSFANLFASEGLSQSFAASIKETMGKAAPTALLGSARVAAASNAPDAASPAAPPAARAATSNRTTAPSPAPMPTPIPSSSSAGSLPQRRSTSTADFGARPTAVAPATVSSFAPSEKDDSIRDTISGFKLANRLVSSLTLKEKISGSIVLGLRAAAAKKKAQTVSIPFNHGGAPPAPGGALGILGNFVVFGVITHKSPPKATSTGKGHFMLWTLSDLDGTAATVLLFGKAFQSYATQVPEGAVVAIANPEEGGKGGGGGGGGSSGGGGWKGGAAGASSSAPSLCFALKHAGQVLHLGLCADFGYCKSYRNEQGTHGGSQKSMARCKNVVNLAKGEYCEYHVKAEYKKIMSNRADLNQSRDRSQIAFSKGEAVPTQSALAKRTNAIGSSIALRASMHQRGGAAAAAGRAATAPAPPVPAANANDPFHWTLDGFREALGSNTPEERRQATAGMPALTLMALMEQDPALMSPVPFTQAQRVQFKTNADAARRKIATQQAKQQRGTLAAAATPAVSYTPAELKAEAQRKILLAGGTLKGGCKAALKVPEAKTAPSEIAAGAARWDALSDRSKVSSRFVQRVVATQLGSIGAPMLTTKDMGMMSAVDKISQGIKQEAKQQGKEAGKMNEVQLAATVQKAAAKTPVATSQPTGRPFSAPAPAATSSAESALANFSYTSKHPQSTSLAAALAAKTPVAPAPAAAAASTQRPAAHAASASTATPASVRPSAAAASMTAPKPTTTRPASAAAPSPTPAPSPPRPAMPSGTFIQSFGAAAPSAAALGSGLVPMLGRGWSHPALNPAQSERPLILNATEKAAQAKQAAQLARVAELRAAGALGKVDPNSTGVPLRPLPNGALAGAKRKSPSGGDDPASAAKSQYSLNSNGSITLTKPAASTMVDDSAVVGSAPVSSSAAALASKRARLSDAFGFGSSASEMDRMLDVSVGSKHSGLIVESASSVAAQEALFNLMEKRETLAVHLNSITAQTVKAYRCAHEGCHAQPSEFPLVACKAKGHKVERVELQKRFFSCVGCKFHLTALGVRMPTHACHKCGGTIWTKAAMIPMKIDSSDRDQLQLRSEETWLRSTN